MTDRRGFTIVELIVVAVLGLLVLTAVLQVLMTNQRTYTAQSAVVQGQQSSRMAMEVLFAELREASPAGGDIRYMDADSIEVRLMRKFGIICDADLLDLVTPTATVLNHSGDVFAAGDTVYVFADNQEATGSDDVWIETVVTGVDATVTCLGGSPATQLSFDPLTAGPLFSSDEVRVGAPVRSYKTFSFFTSSFLGDPYLSRSESGGFGWPIAGPLRALNGLQFVYRDALGSITATPSDVRQIEVRIRTGARVINSVGDAVTDSLDAWIYTRN